MLRVLACTCALLLAPPAAAGADPPAWAPAAEATIYPGVQIEHDHGYCTSNFVFYDDRDVYLGTAAHCYIDGTAGTLNYDCKEKSLPLGTQVRIAGAAAPGTVAYSAWATMADARETDPLVCLYNDFALVRVAATDRAKVNPTMPFWRGPTGLRQTALSPGEKVLAFGNSPLRGGLEALSPKEGYARHEWERSMSHEVITVTHGVPGDSGSGYLDASGNAFGVLSGASGWGGSMVSDLRFQLDYLRTHTALRPRLALATEPFRGPLAGPGLSESPDPQPQPEEPRPQPEAQQPPPQATPPAPAAKKPAKRCKTKKQRRTKRCRAKRGRR